MTELLPGTDNFFKYLLTLGIALILFSLIYPIQKQQAIEIERNKLLEKLAISGKEISFLQKDVEILKSDSKIVQSTLDSLKSLKNIPDANHKQIDAIRDSLYRDFYRRKDINTAAIKEIALKEISNDYESKRLDLLESHIWSFYVFKLIFLIVGGIFSILGYVFWAASSYVDEYQKSHQDQSRLHITSFMYWFEKCRRYRIWVVLILILLFISVVILWIKTAH